MVIQGPLTIRLLTQEGDLQRELHLAFTEEFIQKPVAIRAMDFNQYIHSLEQQAAQIQTDTPERQGILTILQICQELLPYIQQDEIPLEETIVVNIQAEFGLTQFINAKPIH